MDPADLLERSGGVATAAELRATCSRAQIDTALAEGQILRLRRGTYGLPGIKGAEQAALELRGTVCHLSAALLLGWKVKTPPTRPHVALPRGRRLTVRQRKVNRIHWWTTPPPARRTPRGVRVTDAETTVIACLRDLPYDEALAVADSALRVRALSAEELQAAARSAPRTGRAKAIAVAAAADGRAANPFESCLRAICHRVEDLHAEPQVQIGAYRVDLCDRRLRIVIEADSWTHHAGYDEHTNDVRRYTTLVRDGWIVLRFSYHDVMHDPDYVAEVLRDVVAMQATRTTHSSDAA